MKPDIAPDRTTLGEALRARAVAQPDKLALVGADLRFTWSQLDAEVDRVARRYQAVGIAQGDVVGLCTTKRPEVVVAFLALARLGALAAPINFKLETARIVDQFDVSRIRGLLLEARFDDVIAPVVHAVAGRVLYVGGAGRYAGLPYEASGESSADAGARGSASAGSDARAFPAIAPSDPCYLNYTSGTTGRPKGAVHTHAQVLWNAKSGVDGLGFGPDDVFMGMFSVFAHPHELFHRALLTGATCVVIDTLSPRVALDAIAEHGVTWLMAVPSFYEMMLDALAASRPSDGPTRIADTPVTSTLRVLEAGGAWVSADTLARMEAAFGGRFLPVWGSTETCGVAIALTGADRAAGATGAIVAHYTATLHDDHGRIVPAGESGELWVRGPAVSQGYVGMPEETASAFVDGAYRTGDLFRQDERGVLWFVGRRFDMLKVGGIRVFPLEIEQVLYAHPSIAEAVVVRAEERVRGEVPRAVVRLQPGKDATEHELKAFCRAHLAPYKVPRIVEIWPELPKLPNGKLDRRAVQSSSPAAAAARATPHARPPEPG